MASYLLLAPLQRLALRLWIIILRLSFFQGSLATAAAATTVGAGLLYYGQNYLIYPSAFPPGSRTDVPTPTDFGLAYDDLELKTPDGVLLKCYLLPQSTSIPRLHPEAYDVPPSTKGGLETDEELIRRRPTVLMFHGNGGNHGHRIPLAKVFYLRMRCNVLMMSYRGYGLSTGSPSEKGLCIDAQTALDYLLSDPNFSQTPIVLYGQSIGGAVSIDLASNNPSKISALVLENTFTSLPNLIPHAMPFLGPVSFLCHQRWDSASKIPKIPATTPVLMLSGKRDELIPPTMMHELWELIANRGAKKDGVNSPEHKAGSERAKYMEFEFGGHNDTCVQTGYWAAVSEFIRSIIPEDSRAKQGNR
ncbi:Alpha/Beta hydrolase protein [Flagelloscypha sp. PMI_526]|nr:Alpha/Beta hydrolase protein [Flagelloscypha sp. PMI_526]